MHLKVNTDRCHMTFVPLKMQNLRPVSIKSIIKKLKYLNLLKWVIKSKLLSIASFVSWKTQFLTKTREITHFKITLNLQWNWIVDKNLSWWPPVFFVLF